MQPIISLPSIWQLSRGHILLLLLLLCVYKMGLAQTPFYGNEWIQYQQTYCRINVVEEGIYRISGSNLLGSGLSPIAEHLRLYRNGREVPIFISNEGTLSENDYIEFHGTPNDGTLDTLLYEIPQDANRRTSIYTDTATYFLTSSPTLMPPPLRYATVINDTNSPSAAAEPYVMYRSSIDFKQSINNATSIDDLTGLSVSLGKFEITGIVSSNIYGDTFFPSYTVTLPTPVVYTADDAPQSRFSTLVQALNGRKFERGMKLYINGIRYATAQGKGKNLAFKVNMPIFTQDISSPATSVIYHTNEIDDTWESFQKVVFTQIEYPRHPDAVGKALFSFELPNDGEKYLEIAHLNATEAVLYDLTNGFRMTILPTDTLFRIQLPAGTQPDSTRKLLLCRADVPSCNPCNANEKGMFAVSALQGFQFINYLAEPAANYLIITHPYLHTGTTDWVAEYATYRSSTQGGNYTVLVADIMQLYDQYAFGVRQHPLAIRHFINHLADASPNTLAHILLLGKGLGFALTRGNTEKTAQSLIPTFSNGYDHLLAIRQNGDIVTHAAIGRVSAKNPEEIQHYLEKIMRYENPSCDTEMAWAKRAVFFNASQENSLQHESINNLFDRYAQLADTSIQALHTRTISPITTATKDSCVAQYQAGIGLLHVSGEVLANSLFAALQDSMNMAYQYPIGIINYCFIGKNFQPNSLLSFGEKTVLADSSGFAAILATPNFIMISTDNFFYKELYKQWFLTDNELPIGTAIRQAQIIGEAYLSSLDDEEMAKQLWLTLTGKNLEGDPALIPAFVQKKGPVLLSLPDSLVLNSSDLPITIAPQSPNAIAYQWSNGQTDSQISIAEAGTYTVTASNAQGCAAVASVVIDVITSAEYPNANGTSFKIPNLYPNPTMGILTIDNLEPTIAHQVALYDLNGRRLLEKNVLGQMYHTIDLSYLPAGVYWLHISQTAEKRSSVFKIVRR